ncbi:MAG: ISAs1 family transposase [Mycoplasmataceae bacterium]|jgi:predicted transposase YbfD/YdcC|nr:ISAs1 family transposase [Mycoplasmataceae bacterium]
MSNNIKDNFVVIQDIIKNIDINEMTLDIEVIGNFIHYFENIEDSRVKGRCKYKLSNILILSIFAIMHNNISILGIYGYIRMYKTRFTEMKLLENEIHPHRDTISRVFMSLNSSFLHQATLAIFNDFLKLVDKNFDVEGKYRHLAIDGKEVRSSGRNKNTLNPSRNASNLSIYESGTHIVLDTEVIDEKTNEIPVAQKLLSRLDLKNSIITADALHSQIKTTEVIREKGGDYILNVKFNQKELREEMESKFKKIKINEKNHVIKQINQGKLLQKEYYFIKLPKEHSQNDFKDSKSYVIFRKQKEKSDGTLEYDDLYFISSLTSFETIIEGIERRWTIENDLHRYKDALFNEDSIRCTNKTLISNLNIINNMLLVFVKLARSLKKYEEFNMKFIRNAMVYDGEKIFKTIINILGSKKILMNVKKTMLKK